MWRRAFQAAAVLLAFAWTGLYLFSLFFLTFGYCYSQDVGCGRGWVARTVATVVYLVSLALTVAAYQWLKRRRLR